MNGECVCGDKNSAANKLTFFQIYKSSVTYLIGVLILVITFTIIIIIK